MNTMKQIATINGRPVYHAPSIITTRESDAGVVRALRDRAAKAPEDAIIVVTDDDLRKIALEAKAPHNEPGLGD